MGKNRLEKKIFHSKILVLSLIYSFLLLITTEAAPNKVESGTNKEFKPVVRVKETQQRVPASQKDRFERLIEEGKRLFQEEMDYEGAIGKFKEAQKLAITKKQKSDVFFYLSLAYYTTLEEKGIDDFVESVRKLIEVDYNRELDTLLCPPRYVELFQGIKKEYGVLIVQSNPPGADVYLNDSKVSVGKTPLAIGSKSGTVKIVLKKGKKTKKQILSVVAGKEVTTPLYVLKGGSSLFLVVGGLALAGGAGAALLAGQKGNGGGNGGTPGATTGSIQVNSTPTGARVFLDGNDTGQTTNCTLTNVSPGSHTVRLVKEGYEDYQATISVVAGQTTTSNINLTQHTLTINSPTSGTVWTKGDSVEIRWETSGSVGLRAYSRSGTGSNPISYPGTNLYPSSQRRTFPHNPTLPSSLRTRRGRESRGLSKNEEKIRNISSKFQDILEKSSSNGKARNIIPPRAKNTGIIGKNRSFSDPSLRFSPRAFYNPSRQLPQASKPSGNIRALTLTNVKIDLYKGTSQVQTVSSSTANDGSYWWTVDSSLADGTDYRIRISCPTDSSVYNESNTFTIEGKSITVTEPTSSTVWVRGDSGDISWNWRGSISSVKIELYKGTSMVQTIASLTTNDGSYTWSTVDSGLADGTDYKVRITDYYDTDTYGESAQFEIAGATIRVTEPTSGTVWTKGQSANITWTSSGTSNYVKIELYKGTSMSRTIISNTSNDGSHTWPAVDSSLPDGTDYKVRISDYYDSSVYGESDEFQITSVSILTICDAVDNCGLSWSTGGDADWFGQTDSFYYGGDAAQSGAILDNQWSYVQTTVTGPGTLRFYWKVSSEEDFDYLRLYVNGAAVPGYEISGERGWEQRTYSLGAGSHSLKWEYDKDVSISEGSDCGWLDRVEFITGPIPEGFDSQFNDDANGWEVHSGNWWIEYNAWYTTDGLPDQTSSVSYAADFTNFEYEVRIKRYNPSGYVRSNRLYVRGTPDPLVAPGNSWYNSYMFQYDTEGDYSVWKYVNGSPVTVQYWASTPAIYQGNTWNTLKVIANGNDFSFYINGTLVWSGSDSSHTSGRVGVGMYKDGSSSGDHLWVDWATLTPTSGAAAAFGIAGTVSAEQQALNDEANKRRDKNKDINGKPKR